MESPRNPPDICELLAVEHHEWWFDDDPKSPADTATKPVFPAPGEVTAPMPPVKIVRYRSIRSLHARRLPETSKSVAISQQTTEFPSGVIDASPLAVEPIDHLATRHLPAPNHRHWSAFMNLLTIGLALIAIALWLPQWSGPTAQRIEFREVISLLDTTATAEIDRLKLKLQDAILLERRHRTNDAKAIYHDVLFRLSRNEFACTEVQSRIASNYVRFRLQALDDWNVWRFR
jgi:hypothetical protein